MNIRALLPEHIRKQWDAQDAKQAQLAEQMRRECADAVELLASAIRRPYISRTELEEAQRKVARALSVAAVLDPEE